MKPITRFVIFMTAAFVVAALILRDTARREKENRSPEPVPSPSTDLSVPPYQADIRGVPIPKTIPPDLFTVVKTRESYRVAREIPQVLMQLPCYCWCDRIDHKSLLDCFVDDHAEFCGICQDSAFWAHRRMKERASIAMIRQEIIHRYSKDYGMR